MEFEERDPERDKEKTGGKEKTENGSDGCQIMGLLSVLVFVVL